MRPFRFSLAGLEKVRQAAVDRAELALARSEAAKRAEEGHIMGLEQAMVSAATASSREGVLDVGGLMEEEAYLHQLRRQRSEAMGRLEQWIASVERERQGLLQARRERKALERLRERRYLEFIKDVVRDENDVIDEVASVNHQRARQAA